MRKVDNQNHIKGLGFKKELSKKPSFDEALKALQKNLYTRLEKEVPENGIFTPVKESYADDKTSFELSVEYSNNQISPKKDLRILKLYLPKHSFKKEGAPVLFEGTKKEIYNYIKKENLSQTINSIISKEEKLIVPKPHNFGLINIKSSPSFASNISKYDLEKKEQKLSELFGFIEINEQTKDKIINLPDEKFEDFIELFSNKQDEETWTSDPKNKINSFDNYQNYCTRYINNLINIMTFEAPYYKQAKELIKKGANILNLSYVSDKLLNEKEQKHFIELSNKYVWIYPEILAIEDDMEFDIAKRIIQNPGYLKNKGELGLAKEIASDKKTSKNFIELYDHYVSSYPNKKMIINFMDGICPELLSIIQISKECNDVKRAKQLLDNEFSIMDIFDCITYNLKDKDFKRAKELLEKGIKHAIQIASNDDNYSRYNRLKNNHNIKKSDIAISEEKFAKYTKYVKEGMQQETAITVANIEDEEENANACYLAKHNIQGSNIVELSNPDMFKRVKHLFEIGIHSSYIPKFAKDENYNKVLLLLSREISPDSINGYINWLSDDEFKRAIYLLDLGIDSGTVMNFAQCDEKELEDMLKYLKEGLNFYEARTINDLPEETKDEFLKLTKIGLNYREAEEIMAYDPSQKEKFLYLLNNGCVYYEAKNIMDSDEKYQATVEKIEALKTELKDFLNSENYSKEIRKHSQGKYQDEIMEMFHPDTMDFNLKSALKKSKLSKEDFLNALQAFSKSTFKLAYETPNQYLSGIDLKYTKKVNGSYPPLPEYVKIVQQNKMKKFFSYNLAKILRAIKYLDKDTVNQMMDKRTNVFEGYLYRLDELNDNNYKILSDIVKCKSAHTDKPLSAKEKIQFCEIVEMFQKCDLDTALLSKMAQSGKVDINDAKRIIEKQILENSGFSPEEIEKLLQKGLQLNSEYMYTILAKDITINHKGMKELIRHYRNMDEETREYTIEYILSDHTIPADVREIMLELYRNAEKYTDSEVEAMIKNILKAQKQQDDLYVVTYHAALGDFSEFINDPNNMYGEVNLKTKEDFINHKIDFNEWLNPTIEDDNFDIRGNLCTIKMWERNPNEDLFIGNKTNCCTAIGEGSNAAATPAYLLNHSFNVVELFDENNNAVGMSRIFMAQIDNKPALIMDNIEINQNFNKYLDNNERDKIRDEFFKYINKFAKKVTGDDDTQVYFSTKYAKFKTDDLASENKIMKFIGEVSQEKIYINCLGNFIEYEKLDNEPIDLYVVPRER